MPLMIEITCANKKCGDKKMVRAADVKRGWGKFCSKSCKAAKQEARTGQYKKYLNAVHNDEYFGGNYIAGASEDEK